MALRVFQQLTGFYINQVLIDGANEIAFLVKYSQSFGRNHVDSQQSIGGGHFFGILKAILRERVPHRKRFLEPRSPAVAFVKPRDQPGYARHAVLSDPLPVRFGTSRGVTARCP
jgi:hypothetical protein